MPSEHDKVIILDAGSQFCKLIDRVVRGLSVETVISPLNTSASQIEEGKFKAVIITGSPGSVIGNDGPTIDPNVFSLKLPILGICYGMQLITCHFGGKIEKLERREDAQTVIRLTKGKGSPLYDGLEAQQEVLLTHGDCCTHVPHPFEIDAVSSNGVAVSIFHQELKMYGVQFHPEVDLTTNGRMMLSNFLFKISGCSPKFVLSSRVETCVKFIKDNVQDNKKVIALVSGGLDSTVCACLINRALGPDRLISIFVDHGLMRHNEVDNVRETFQSIGIPLKVVDAGIEFLHGTTVIKQKEQSGLSNVIEEIGPLCSVFNPEHKRIIIGDTFMKVVDKTLKSLGLESKDCILAQGTLRPDLIESASPTISKLAETIKTHHNDTNLVRQMRSQGRILEPLKDFHKDEVREIALQLDLPPSVVYRHPFPGPGLAIRMICGHYNTMYVCQSESRYETQSLASFIANFHKHHLKDPHPIVKFMKESLSSYDIDCLAKATANSCFEVTLLPIRSVGVQGDGRSYKNIIVLSTDDMDPSWEGMQEIAKVIPKLCTSVNRVVYAFGPAIRHSIYSLTTVTITPANVADLRAADHIVNSVLHSEKVYNSVSQFPVILIPIHFDLVPAEGENSLLNSIVLRPFISSEFMTGVPAVPGKHIPVPVVKRIYRELVQNVMRLSRVLYDLTPKPPATTEWE